MMAMSDTTILEAALSTTSTAPGNNNVTTNTIATTTRTNTTTNTNTVSYNNGTKTVIDSAVMLVATIETIVKYKMSILTII